MQDNKPLRCRRSLLKFIAEILAPKKNLLGINPLTGILSTWYRLRSMDGTDSIPFRILCQF